MSDDEFRRVVLDAATGINSLNRFIETRFEMADEFEARDPDSAAAAEEMRATWTHVWEVLGGAPQRAIWAELHDILCPQAADDEALDLALNA